MIRRLDGLLGRLTMYRLVIVCLAALGAAAFGLSLLGLVRPGDALPMLASAAALLTVSYLANGLLALLFRVRPHSDSTIITALLLFFILPPARDLAGIGALALAALIAVASKYLLAVRGRHIFNPAALGAFVTGLTGLAFGQWWIGTPWLLPLVVIGSFLVLVRTRRIAMAGVYVVVAAMAAMAQYLVLGADPLSALQFAVLSSPVVFVAGFMLSEPLTLAPRRWQQFALAALAGVLTSVVFEFGALYNSPELALLVANAIAFGFGQRRAIRLEFTGKRQLSPTSWEFDFRPLQPVSFRPGQFMELTLPHRGADARGWRRVFSIASAPAPDGVLRFGVRIGEPVSSFKRALLELEPGARVQATTVGGDFVPPEDPRRPLLFVAGGIGITPFIGHLEEFAREDPARDVVVVYAVSSTDDLAYADRFARAGCRVLVAAPADPGREGWTWLGPGRLTGERLLEAVPDARNRVAYLSGPPGMVADLGRALRRAGVRRIRTDVFVGY